jgi:GT2 family glycosyltransferase
MDRRSVTVVIPTYNNARLLRDCLVSLRDLDYPRELLRVVVVDNASHDDTVASIAAAGRSLTVQHIRLDENTGFAPACNRGAREASTEWVAFLNDDAVADPQWLNAMFAVAMPGQADRIPGEAGAACVASQIKSRDGSKVEYDGASSNLFGAGRPTSVWGWTDMPVRPGTGSPVLFASGGAMLVHRATFLDAGGFDPEYFAYFEDVDLGWRLWVLGHRVLYAPDAIVRHIGGATGKRAPSHMRYTLWECNSLATIVKNYEERNIAPVLTAALLLEYKRALMSAGDAVSPDAYKLTAPREDNPDNVERLPRVSVAHIAAIDRFNRLLPHFMAERRRIQASRARPDSEILPLMGHLWQPQFAGTPYADAARQLFSKLDLYSLVGQSAPMRVLVLAPDRDEAAARLAQQIASAGGGPLVALVYLSEAAVGDEQELSERYVVHRLGQESDTLQLLASHADALLFVGEAAQGPLPHNIEKPMLLLDAPSGVRDLPRAHRVPLNDIDRVLAFCRDLK